MAQQPCSWVFTLEKRKRMFTQKTIHKYLYSSSTQNHQKLETSNSTCEWINKLWYIQTMEYYSVMKRNEKECVCWYTQQCRWISKALCWLKEASLKRLRTARFHVYGMCMFQKRQKYRDKKTGEWLSGVTMGEGVTSKRRHESVFWVMEVFIQIVVVSIYLYICVKIHKTLNPQKVIFTLCKLQKTN